MTMTAAAATPSRRRRRAAGGGRGSATSSRNREFDADADEGFISAQHQRQEEQEDTGARTASRTNKTSKAAAKAITTSSSSTGSTCATSLKSASSGANSTAAMSDSGEAAPSKSEARKKSGGNNKSSGRTKAAASLASASGRTNGSKDRSKSKTKIRAENDTGASRSTWSSSVSGVSADARTIERALLKANEQAGTMIPSSSLLKIISRASAAASVSMLGSGGGGCGGEGGSKCGDWKVVEGILLLEEKVGDVLSVVKKCLRVATSTSSGGGGSGNCSKTPKKTSSSEGAEKAQVTSYDDKVAHLRLAVHCLRAVCPLISGDGKREGQMMENAFRLLYHAIVASEDVCAGASSSSGAHGVRMDAAGLCLASCSVLSHLLTGLGMSRRGCLDGDEEFMITTGEDMEIVQQPPPLLMVLMNIPTDRLGEVGPMTAVQLAKIGAQSLLSACTVLSSMFVDSAFGSGAFCSENDDVNDQSLTDEFGFSLVDANLMGRSDQTCHMPTPSFQLLIRTVVPSWLNVFLNDTSKEGVDGALSYSKRYQRLLWEAAARLEKKTTLLSSRSKNEKGSNRDMVDANGSHFRRLTLSLRGDSILASLVMSDGIGKSHHASANDIASSVDLRAAILEDRLAYACECAWKSATTFAQGVVAASSPDPTWYGGLGRTDSGNENDKSALVQFHHGTGGAIDALVQARLNVRSEKCDEASPPPFSYIEYCANRAMHVGPEEDQSTGHRLSNGHNDKENSLGGGASGNGMGQEHRIDDCELGRENAGGSSSCNHDDCIYSCLPFAFIHDQETHASANATRSDDTTFLCGSATLCVVFATLQAATLVYSPRSSCGSSLQFDDRLFPLIDTTLLSSKDGRRQKISVLVQCQKMLAPLKLSSRAMHVGKFVGSRSGINEVDPMSIAGANLVQRVIGECYAPLLSLLASVEGKSTSSVSSGTKASRLEMAQDCYIRAAMLADHLDGWTSNQSCRSEIPNEDNKFNASADEALRRVHKLAVGSSDKNAIMVAKSIGAVGKQRSERENTTSAIVPMLLSAEIFASLFESSRSSSYKLPTRFQQLSSLFESAGMPDEAIAALGFAIHYKMRESVEDVDHFNELDEASVCRTILRSVEIVGGGAPFLVQSSSDGSSESQTVASCQFFSRLMRLYVKYYRGGSREEPLRASFATLSDTIKRSRIGKTLEMAVSLDGSDHSQAPLPVYRVFQLLITRSGIKGLEAVAQVAFLNRVLFMFGRVLAGEVAIAQNDTAGEDSNNDEVKEWISNQLSTEFTGFLKLALTCASKGRGNAIPEQQYRQYEASIYMSASASFYIDRLDKATSEKSNGDADLPNLLRSAIKYAEKAKSLLQKASDEDEDRSDRDRLLLCVQRLAVDYYFAEVSRVTRSKPFSECSSSYEGTIKAMEDIFGHMHQYRDCPSLVDVNAFLAFTLARMNSEMQLMGYSTLSVRAAALLARLQHSHDIASATSGSSTPAPLPADQVLAVSNLVLALSEGGFHGACRSLLQSFLSRSYNGDHVDDFAGALTAAASSIFARETISINEIDLLASALLVQIQSSGPDHHDVSSRTLNDIAETVREQEDCEDASSWVHVRWILSTCQMGIAQQMEKAGNVPRSLGAYRDCSKSCRSALAFLRSPSGRSAAVTIDPNTILHPYNILHRFSVRLSQCLRDASSLYCRQGNYNKGEGYALSLVDAISALPDFATKASKKGTSDLIDLLEASSVDESVRRADALQFFVEIQGLSRDSVMVSSEFEERGNNPSSFADDNIPEKALQNVRSAMSYGDIVARGTLLGGIPSFLSYHDQSYSNLLQISSQDFFDEGCIPIIDDIIDNGLDIEQFEHLMSETRLRQANRPSQGEDDDNASSSSSLYRLVSESGYTSGLSRARSYYHIGLQYLSEARRNGDLYQLWRGHSEFSGGAVLTYDTTREEMDSTSRPSSINNAREFFTKAAALAGPASTLLSRQVMRCLALATGPDVSGSSGAEVGYAATVLVHSSVGSTQRQKVAQAFTSTGRSAAQCNDSRLGPLFEALDTALNDRSSRNAAIQSMYDEASLVLPADWRFVALASCPTGELLVSAIFFHNGDGDQKVIATETICIFPGDDMPSHVYEGILKPFDVVMERSRSQLKDMDSSSLNRYSENERKRIWWEEREAIDEQLQIVIQEVEAKYFNFGVLQSLLVGSKVARQDNDPDNDYVATMCQGFENNSSDDEEEELECSLGNLANKFEAACAVMDEEKDIYSDLGGKEDTAETMPAPEKMTVAQIKDELQSLGVDKSEFKQMRKAALVELLQVKRSENCDKSLHERGNSQKKRRSKTHSPRRRSTSESKTSTRPSSMSSCQELDNDAESTCTFLILDEDLQRFPFEGLKSMEGRSICRVPSISFAVATLLERGQRRIQTDNTKYVLDPEANLSSTKRTMLSALDSLTSKFKWTWQGVVGEIPSSDFMEAALTSQSGLFLYCGHGGGEKCFSRKQVEGLLMPSGGSGSSGAGYGDSSDDESDLSPRRCSSALLLMGCSSGRLVSVNSSRTSPPKNLALEYEPEGMALSYLCAGAPCVVGNLWDVTDRDIDRFCLALLEDFLDPRGEASKSLPQCVAKARSVCKMRHIVGAAPVVYGVPVVAEKISQIEME